MPSRPCPRPSAADTARRFAPPAAAAGLFALILTATCPTPAAAGPPGAVGDAYISSDVLNTTAQHDGVTGSLVGVQYISNAAVGQLAVHFGTANNRVLIGHFTGGVEEFDAVSGTYIKTYNAVGGTAWAGIYAPNGEVYVGDWTALDVGRYDASSGAYIGSLTTANMPADMEIGPDGNLYICEYAGYSVKVVDANSGAFVDTWSLPFGARANDIAFPAGGGFLVTAMGTNLCHVFDASHNPIATFAGTGWMRPHGIAISPFDGNIYAVDGVTAQVHIFDPVTFNELNAAWLSPAPGGKIVDVVFRPQPGPVQLQQESWGGIKQRYR